MLRTYMRARDTHMRARAHTTLLSIVEIQLHARTNGVCIWVSGPGKAKRATGLIHLSLRRMALCKCVCMRYVEMALVGCASYGASSIGRARGCVWGVKKTKSDTRSPIGFHAVIVRFSCT